MRKKLECLDKHYSTTRLCYKLIGEEYLDADGKIKEDQKFNITIPEAGIENSKIPKRGQEQFDTYLFLPEGEDRKGEGGLRTKGYFKFSYRKLVKEGDDFKESKYGEWYAVDWRGNPLFRVEFPEEVLEEIEREGITYLPLITVITVVLNGEKTLEETIRSVLWQTYPNVEYIIIDGGSTDRTLDIIRKYKDAIDFWTSEKDKGIYDAMNKGVSLAFGQWINFMNAGDKFYNYEVIEKISSFIATEKYGVIYGDSIVNYLKFKRFFEARDFAYIKYGMPFSHQACFVKTCLHKQFPFDLSFKLASDYHFLFNLHLYKKQQFLKVNIIISENQAFGKAFLDRKSVLTEYKKINNNISNLYVIKEYIKGFIWKHILKFYFVQQ